MSFLSCPTFGKGRRDRRSSYRDTIPIVEWQAKCDSLKCMLCYLWTMFPNIFKSSEIECGGCLTTNTSWLSNCAASTSHTVTTIKGSCSSLCLQLLLSDMALVNNCASKLIRKFFRHCRSPYGEVLGIIAGIINCIASWLSFPCLFYHCVFIVLVFFIMSLAWRETNLVRCLCCSARFKIHNCPVIWSLVFATLALACTLDSLIRRSLKW